MKNFKTRQVIPYCFTGIVRNIILLFVLQLFDLLGFDIFELIQEILTNRRQIVESALGDNTFLSQHDANKLPPNLQEFQQQQQLQQVRPNYGCQITIQTEEERRMMKLIRKEERKLDRRRQAEESDADQFSIDPELWREQR